MNSHLCDIESALGRSEVCDPEECPFWQDGGCVVAGARADLRTTAGLPELLLLMRHRLADAATCVLDRSLVPGEYR